MTARRLAREQPDSFTLSAASKKEIAKWVRKYPKGRQRSALIPALWIVQKQADGWLPAPALEAVADLLEMPYIRVYEVATFYTMFNLAPVGEHHVQLCGTTPCWLRGAGDLKKVCESKIGPKGSVSADGKFSWIEVECLGACANAPMVQISNADGDDYYEDLDVENFGTLLDDLAAGRKVSAGPQNKRHTSEPITGAATLNAKGFYSKVKQKKLPGAVKAKVKS
ncbi:MAG: NADH-quinone oxidoreductase subunit NuoE [Robiginitomaculum sp.]|nr:NADH-quinone oxidoreductase subunit NuoE [Robiginitomaculum sp.]